MIHDEICSEKKIRRCVLATYVCYTVTSDYLSKSLWMSSRTLLDIFSLHMVQPAKSNRRKAGAFRTWPWVKKK